MIRKRRITTSIIQRVRSDKRSIFYSNRASGRLKCGRRLLGAGKVGKGHDSRDHLRFRREPYKPWIYEARRR